MNNKPEIYFYPNPAVDIINIELQQKMQDDFTVTISTIEGKIIYKKSFDKSIADCQIPVQNFINGNYILTIKSNNINNNFTQNGNNLNILSIGSNSISKDLSIKQTGNSASVIILNN